MLHDPQNFLHSLCRLAVTRAAALTPACTVSYAVVDTAPFNLWLNAADELTVQTPYSVLRNYGGSKEVSNPAPTISVQLATYGYAPAAWKLANNLFRAFVLDETSERELRMLSVPGYTLDDNTADGTWMLSQARTINAPGQIGADEKGRIKIVSNFDLTYFKAA